MEGHRMTNEIAGRAGKTERVLYLDCLRILSIAAMMLLHISAQNWSSLDLHDPAWMLFDILNGATRWCVPVFLMISGALFLNSLRPISTKKLLLHNVLRVVTAFLFWACVYGFWNFRNGEPAKEAFLSIFPGHYHMWFLFLIVGLYFVSPLLRCVVGNAQVLKYYLLCFAALDFAIPWLMDCLLLVRIPHTVDALTAIRLAYDRLLGYLPSENVFYFVLGSYLASKEIPKKKSRDAVHSGSNWVYWNGLIDTEAIALKRISGFNVSQERFCERFPDVRGCICVWQVRNVQTESGGGTAQGCGLCVAVLLRNVFGSRVDYRGAE